MSLFKRVRSSKDYSARAFSVSNMFYGKKELSNINENYDLSNTSTLYTNSEQLKRVSTIDSGKLLTYALSNESVHLLFAPDISEIFEDKADDLNKNIKDDEKNNEKPGSSSVEEVYTHTLNKDKEHEEVLAEIAHYQLDISHVNNQN